MSHILCRAVEWGACTPNKMPRKEIRGRELVARLRLRDRG
jgi:hypothetical protein